jgi:hypothetical protein
MSFETHFVMRWSSASMLTNRIKQYPARKQATMASASKTPWWGESFGMMSGEASAFDASTNNLRSPFRDSSFTKAFFDETHRD